MVLFAVIVFRTAGQERDAAQAWPAGQFEPKSGELGRS
jgi:hypothetical protein